MRPDKPLPPISTPTSNATGKKLERKKRKLEKVKLVRARRRTIDPTRWDSQHLKGAFLDSVIVADDGDKHPVTMPPQPQTPVNEEKSDSPSSEDDEDEETDESDASEYQSVAEELSTNPKAAEKYPLSTHADYDTIDTDHDLNEEKFRTLSLLDSMFGGLEGGQEWGGREELDSDIEMPEPPPVDAVPPPKPSPQTRQKGTNPIPPAEDVQEDSENEKSASSGVPSPVPEGAPASSTAQDANATKSKLKDLFAPQEEQSALPLTIDLS